MAIQKVHVHHPALLKIARVTPLGDEIILDGLSSLAEGRIESDVVFPIDCPAKIKVTTLTGESYSYTIPVVEAMAPCFIEHLNDIGDVNVPNPQHGYVLAFDQPSGLWICKDPLTELLEHIEEGVHEQPQPPAEHGNEKHAPDFATADHTHTLLQDVSGEDTPYGGVGSSQSGSRYETSINAGADSPEASVILNFAAISRAVGVAWALGGASASSALKLRLYMGGVLVAESGYISLYPFGEAVYGSKSLSGSQEVSAAIHNYSGSTCQFRTYSNYVALSRGYGVVVGSVKI